MSSPIRRSIYLSASEWKRLDSICTDFGFEGRGRIISFLKKITSPNLTVVLIEGSVKVEIKNDKGGGKI